MHTILLLIREAMALKRFRNLTQYLHLSSKEDTSKSQDKNIDLLWKAREAFNYSSLKKHLTFRQYNYMKSDLDKISSKNTSVPTIIKYWIMIKCVFNIYVNEKEAASGRKTK